MVEVFKTDVHESKYALLLQQLIQTVFTGYEVSFDLEDCDKVLRVKSCSNDIRVNQLIDFLKQMGVQAEVLPEDVPPPKDLENENYGRQFTESTTQ